MRRNICDFNKLCIFFYSYLFEVTHWHSLEVNSVGISFYIYVYMYICIYVYMYIYIYICIYIYIHTYTHTYAYILVCFPLTYWFSCLFVIVVVFLLFFFVLTWGTTMKIRHFCSFYAIPAIVDAIHIGLQ